MILENKKLAGKTIDGAYPTELEINIAHESIARTIQLRVSATANGRVKECCGSNVPDEQYSVEFLKLLSNGNTILDAINLW